MRSFPVGRNPLSWKTRHEVLSAPRTIAQVPSIPAADLLVPKESESITVKVSFVQDQQYALRQRSGRSSWRR
jgi:hypothetical protein